MEESREVQFAHFKLWRQSVGIAQDPGADLVFPEKDHRPDRKQNVVKGDGNYRGNLAASENPGGKNGKQRFQTCQWCKSPEDADGRSTGNGVRSISELMQLLSSILGGLLDVKAQPHGCRFSHMTRISVAKCPRRRESRNQFKTLRFLPCANPALITASVPHPVPYCCASYMADRRSQLPGRHFRSNRLPHRLQIFILQRHQSHFRPAAPSGLTASRALRCCARTSARDCSGRPCERKPSLKTEVSRQRSGR